MGIDIADSFLKQIIRVIVQDLVAKGNASPMIMSNQYTTPMTMGLSILCTEPQVRF